MARKKTQISKFTVLAGEISEIVNTRGNPKEVAATIWALKRAIQGLGALPPEVSEKMWTMLLTLFRKLITKAATGRDLNEPAEQYLLEINDGFHGKIKEEMTNTKPVVIDIPEAPKQLG